MFDILKNYLDLKLQKSEEKLDQLENEIKSIKECSSEKIFSLTEEEAIVLIDSSNELKSAININYVRSIFKVKNFLTQLNTNISEIDNDELSDLLSILDLSENELKKLIENLKTVEELYPIISDENNLFNDEQIKTNIFNLFNDIKKLILNNYEKLIRGVDESITQIDLSGKKTTLENIKNQILKLQKYLTYFNNDGPVATFENTHDMIGFLTFIKDSDIDSEVALNLVTSLIKYNLIKSRENEEQIDSLLITSENSDLANDMLMEKFENVEQEPVNINYDEHIESMTPEETQLLDQVKQLIILNTSGSIDKFEREWVDLFKNDFSLDERKDFYYSQDTINWDFIAADFENLILSLDSNKDEIFKILNYIIDIYNKFQQIKLENENRCTKLNEKKTYLEEIIMNSKILGQYDSYDEKQKNLILSVINLIGKLGNEEALTIIKDTSLPSDVLWYKYLEILIKLRKITSDISEAINGKNIPEDIFNIIIDSVNEYSKEYELIKEQYNTNFSNQEEEVNEDENSNWIEQQKNLILFKFDDIKDYDEDDKAELLEVLKLLEKRDFFDLQRDVNHLVAELWYIKSNGKKEIYEEEKFKAYRIKGRRNSRTGIVKINVCPENQQKLRDRYNFKGNLGSIFIMLGVIKTVRGNHDNYEDMISEIKLNSNEINKVADLFNNPQAPEDEIYSIIDKALKTKQDILDGQKSGGGKSI